MNRPMSIYSILTRKTKEGIKSLFNSDISIDTINIQETRKEFEGDFTIVVFPFLQYSKKNPEQTAQELGNYLKKHTPEISEFNVVKGFLNLTINKTYWLFFLQSIFENPFFDTAQDHTKTIMVEYSSPNTNKPLHLGHLRNNFIGHAISEILKTNGTNVIKVNLVNDRGIHICKTMLAWQKWNNNETPETARIKGDHLVGKYYVRFDQEYKNEIEKLVSKGNSEETAKTNAPLIKEAQLLLQKWENNDPDVRNLWKTMNSWVYEGFEKTYNSIGIEFDKTYYESDTYELGKKIILKGLDDGIFNKKEDDSVWINLTQEGLDEKLVLRSDGTSVYITQDIGTADQRLTEYDLEKIIYVVGNEQDYHFKVLQHIMQKLNKKWSNKIQHLSHGMVDLPSGKMKSREGTIVDADELIRSMLDIAEQHTKELGKIDGFTNEKAKELFETIGIGALKYHLLKVDPKKRILFNPHESIDFHGHTGPFIQYTYARIQSVLRKSETLTWESEIKNLIAENNFTLYPDEKSVIVQIHKFQYIIKDAAKELNPSIIANYLYELAKTYNKFYTELSILSANDIKTTSFRICISYLTSQCIKKGMKILGINVPDRM